jgi:phosphatidylglycerophosphatase A
MVFILTAAGIYLTTLTEKFLKKTDPALVVIDEWVGQWITLLPLIYSGRDDLFLFVLGLIFFRLFDIKKPFGIYQLQSLPGGWGMMADDVLAGVYSALLLYLITLAF